MLVLSDNKISPFGLKCSVSSGECWRSVKAIVEYLTVKAFKGCGEYSAGMEVNRLIGGPKAEDVLIPEFLAARPK